MMCWKLTVAITVGILLTVGASPFVNYQLEGEWTNEEISAARKSRQSFIMLNEPIVDEGENPESDSDDESLVPKLIIRVNPDMETERSSLPPLGQNFQPSDLSMEDRENIALNFLAKYEYGGSKERVSKSELVKKMQKNYGITESGNLDDETMTLMMSPRCGVPDEPEDYNYFPGSPKWKKTTVTFRVVGYSPDISPCQTRNALKRALRIWEEQVELTFVEKRSPDEKVDMEILFGYGNHRVDRYPFDGESGTLAHAFPPFPGIGGDTHFDESEFWTLGKGQISNTYNGNSNGSPCKFPFIYEGKSHFSCITNDDGLDWCATTEDFDQDGKFGFCPHEKLFTYGGNSDRNPCVFPFTSNGKTYTKCTSDGRNDGYKWCATTSNYDQDKKFGFCPDRIGATKEGNSDGAPCVFPFTASGRTYTSCTWHGRRRSWCATTSNYEQDQKWGYCKGNGFSLYIVAAHEFGHAMGMGHSNTRGALMYPTYHYEENLKLTDDDIRGIRNLYGGPRTSTLPPLRLEQCGGQVGDDPGEVPTPSPSTQAPQTTTTGEGSVPTENICSLQSIDAVLSTGYYIYIFKGEVFWRIDNERKVKRGPFPISTRFAKGPATVDAIYQRPQDRKTYVFSGKQYYVYNRNVYVSGPTSISELGLNVDKIDGILNWWRSKYRTHTFIYVGDKYYRLNERKHKIDKGYPKPNNIWDSTFVDIDAVIPDPISKRRSIFFRGGRVYSFNNYKMDIDGVTSLSTWLKCSQTKKTTKP